MPWNFRKNRTDTWDEFISLKQKEGFLVIDTHMHPLDVLGVVNHSKLLSGNTNKFVYPKPSIVDILDFERKIQILLRVLFRHFPGIIKKAISNLYADSSSEFFIAYLNNSAIDQAVFIPIEPTIKTSALFNSFSVLQKKVIFLGSVDLKKTVYELIDYLEEQLNKFGIKGIKLHPNFQGFYPEPFLNTPEIAEKLWAIYKFAEKKKLYILFHGGESNLWQNTVYPNAGRRFGRLENFISNGSSSEFFDNINTPIVIAHLGMHNLSKPPIPLIKIIIEKYPNVFFDTSGVSSRSIEEVVKSFGVNRIVFGSDAPYYNAKSALSRVFFVLSRLNSDITLEESARKVFGENFFSGVLRQTWR